MKDEKLEKEFNGYFEGLDIPANLTADAKTQVKKRGGFNVRKFAAIASVAASFILVCTVAAVTFFNAFAYDNKDGANDDIAAPVIETYSDGELTSLETLSPYSIDDQNLKFLQKLAYSSNATVSEITVRGFDDGSKAHAYASLTVLSSYRDDTEVYIEYSDKTYAPLKDYADGSHLVIEGLDCYLTKETDEKSGEPVNKLLILKGEVKYYFTVISSNPDSYEKYVKMVL